MGATPSAYSLAGSSPEARPARMSVRRRPEAVHQLSAEDVDLAVQDATAVGDVDLLLGELLDEILELLVRERAEIGERVHAEVLLLLGTGRARIAAKGCSSRRT